MHDQPQAKQPGCGTTTAPRVLHGANQHAYRALADRAHGLNGIDRASVQLARLSTSARSAAAARHLISSRLLIFAELSHAREPQGVAALDRE
jgi:hypothetical protein